MKKLKLREAVPVNLIYLCDYSESQIILAMSITLNAINRNA